MDGNVKFSFRTSKSKRYDSRRWTLYCNGKSTGFRISVGENMYGNTFPPFTVRYQAKKEDGTMTFHYRRRRFDRFDNARDFIMEAYLLAFVVQSKDELLRTY